MMNGIDQIIDIRKTLQKIWEEEMPAAPPPDAAPAMPEQGQEDQADLDRDIDDVMTTPKISSPDDQAISNIADDLSISDTAAFTRAFDALRSGAAPEEMDPAVMADAFRSLMSSDASTVQKAINRLRDIYKKPSGASAAD